MQLELAQGRNPLSGKMAVNRSLSGKVAVNKLETLYLLVPDPREVMPPIFVRLDEVAKLPVDQLKYLLDAVAPFNTNSNIKNIRAALFSSLREDDTDYVETASTVVDIVDTILGWFEGSSSSGGPAAPGSIVGYQGFVAHGKDIGGHMTLFGIHPAKRQMIAFSNPENFRLYFPNIPPGFGTPTFPAIPLPPLPTGMLNFVLNHPDKVVREKNGGGFEVVPGAGPVGFDNNGNPVIDPPAPDPKEETTGNGLSKFLPAAIAAFLIFK